MIVSEIQLRRYVDGRYTVRIRHEGSVAHSGKYKDARSAYADAENKLIVKPGYVNSIPTGER